MNNRNKNSTKPRKQKKFGFYD